MYKKEKNIKIITENFVIAALGKMGWLSYGAIAHLMLL